MGEKKKKIPGNLATYLLTYWNPSSSSILLKLFNYSSSPFFNLCVCVCGCCGYKLEKECGTRE